LRSVYSKARKIIETEWTGEDHRKGIGFIDTILFTPDHQNQDMDLIDKDLLTGSGRDEEFGDRFFGLIKKINSMAIKENG
jgi:hypothetical protein